MSAPPQAEVQPAETNPDVERYEREINLLHDHVATLEAELERSSQRIDELETLLRDRERGEATRTVTAPPNATPETRSHDEFQREAALKSRLAGLRSEIAAIRSGINRRSQWLAKGAQGGSVSDETRRTMEANIERSTREAERLEEQAFALEQQLLAPR